MDEGNGLSPFDVDMDIASDLINLIEDLFRPPKRDLWDNPKNEIPQTHMIMVTVKRMLMLTIHET